LWGDIQDIFLFGCLKTIDITGFFKKFCIATRTIVGASFVSLAPTFLQKSERAHAAAPPLQIEPASLGFDLVFFDGNRKFCIAIRTMMEQAERLAPFFIPAREGNIWGLKTGASASAPPACGAGALRLPCKAFLAFRAMRLQNLVCFDKIKMEFCYILALRELSLPLLIC
jgi:hypothetical protein